LGGGAEAGSNIQRSSQNFSIEAFHTPAQALPRSRKGAAPTQCRLQVAASGGPDIFQLHAAGIAANCAILAL
jgi:hypothetical protein